MRERISAEVLPRSVNCVPNTLKPSVAWTIGMHCPSISIGFFAAVTLDVWIRHLSILRFNPCSASAALTYWIIPIKASRLDANSVVSSANMACAAWAKFYSLWPILGKRDGNLAKRLRLFDSCVTQSALWCNESWVLTPKEKRMLQSTQNNKLRKTWVDWIQRSTRIARFMAHQAGVRMWLETHLQSKWCWAGHVMRMDTTRLAKRGLEWRDSQWWSAESELPSALRFRRPGRTHWFRYEDDLKRFALHSGWPSLQAIAQKRDASGRAYEWLLHRKRFANFAK